MQVSDSDSVSCDDRDSLFVPWEFGRSIRMAFGCELLIVCLMKSSSELLMVIGGVRCSTATKIRVLPFFRNVALKGGWHGNFKSDCHSINCFGSSETGL